MDIQGGWCNDFGTKVGQGEIFSLTPLRYQSVYARSLTSLDKKKHRAMDIFLMPTILDLDPIQQLMYLEI